MWEITIKSSKEHSYMLEYIEKNLITHLRDKIVVGKYCFFDCCLSVGTKKENEAEVWGFLKRVLCDVFCQYFKEEFLKNNLACFLNNNPYSKVVLKAFTYFDLELERSISYRLIDYSNCIVLESAMHFKLNFLIKKWGNLLNG